MFHVYVENEPTPDYAGEHIPYPEGKHDDESTTLYPSKEEFYPVKGTEKRARSNSTEQEEKTKAAKTAREKELVQITTFNVGHRHKVMHENGTPRAEFIVFLESRRRPSVIILQEVHLTVKDPEWKSFIKSMLNHAPWLKLALLMGPAGTCLMYSDEITHASVHHAGVSQNTVNLQIRRTNLHDAGARISIWGVYFPFGRMNGHEMLPTMQKIKASTAEGENFTIVVGDFNGERWHKRDYSAKLTDAGLKRVETGPTGKPSKKEDGLEDADKKSGGKAQGAWASDLTKILRVEVLTTFDELSNHHRPVVFDIAAINNDVKVRPLNLHSEMRFIPQRNSDIGHHMEQATTFEELEACIRLHTVIKGEHRGMGKHRDKTDMGNRRTNHEQKMRIKTVQEKMGERMIKKEKALFQAAITNGPLLKCTIMDIPPDILPDMDSANKCMVQAMRNQFKKKPCVPDEYFANFSPFIELKAALAAALVAPWTWQQLLPSRKDMGHTKTYSDVESKVAHKMGQNAMTILAKKFDEWSQGVNAESLDLLIQKLIGIPTRKAHKETELLKILQKIRRPIGIQSLFRSWHSGAEALRLRDLVTVIAPGNMHAFIPNREGHDMVLKLIILIAMTEPKVRPLWIFQGDNVKCFDSFQFEIIRLLDKIMGLPKPYFEVMAWQFEETINEVRVVNEKAEQMRQESGATQGNQKVPALCVLILAPLAQKLQENAQQAQMRENSGAPMHTRSVDNFADDWSFASDDLIDNVSRFVWARKLLRSIGMDYKLVAVACNDRAHMLYRNGYDPNVENFKPNSISIEDTDEEGNRIIVEYPIQDSLRLLGMCVHVKKDGKCANTRCKRCNFACTTRMCPDCQELVLNNIRALPLKITDKVECVNQRVISSYSYGAYSCTRTRNALLSLEHETRKRLWAYGAGGYIVGAHLPAKNYGLGLRDTMRALAIDTVATLERGMARGTGTMLAQIVELFKKKGEWPATIVSALSGSEQDETPMITAKPHYSLLAQADSSQRRIQIAWSWSRIEKRTIVQALARATDGCDTQHLLHKEGDDNALNIVKILAQIIETENQHAAIVVMEKPWPKEIESMVEPIRRSVTKTIGKPHRVFLSALARTDVNKFQEEDAVFANYLWPAVSTEATLTPDAYPLSIKIWGQSIVTGSTRENSIAELKKKQQLEFWEGNRQLAKLVPDPKLVDLDLCPIAITLKGTYYTGEMPARRANLLMKILTGAEIKTNQSKCQAPACQTSKMVDGKFKTFSEVALTLEHIVSHVNKADVPEILEAIKALGMKWTWLYNNIQPYSFLGLVHPRMTSWKWNRTEEKEFIGYMRKAAAIMAEYGLAAYEICSGQTKESDDTPELYMVATKDEAETYQYQAAADYSGHEVKKEGQPTVYYMGLGGEIKKGGKVIHSFQIRRQIPCKLANSTIGEHFAHVVLIKMCAYHELDDVCFMADNNAVPNHITGEFACSDAATVVVKAAAEKLLVGMKRRHGWIPRLQNKGPDERAGLAAKGHQVVGQPPEYFKELDELISELSKDCY